MKKYLVNLLAIIVLTSFTALAQSDSDTKAQQDAKPMQLVEASCGACTYGMEGYGCSLAVKIDGKTYPVKGVDFHALGDAHAAHGLCNAVRVAETSGELVEDIFHASSFELLPAGTKLPEAEKPKE